MVPFGWFYQRLYHDFLWGEFDKTLVRCSAAPELVMAHVSHLVAMGLIPEAWAEDLSLSCDIGVADGLEKLIPVNPN